MSNNKTGFVMTKIRLDLDLKHAYGLRKLSGGPR